jgi:hypothetical protein
MLIIATFQPDREKGEISVLNTAKNRIKIICKAENLE